jgi:hypothetical protein
VVNVHLKDGTHVGNLKQVGARLLASHKAIQPR